MLTLILVALESITRPRANIPAKMMPMDVSSLMPVRRLTEPINRAIRIPAGTAAKKGLIPNRNAITIPGSTEWARASPMKARPRVMTYAPRMGHIIPTRTETTSARTMKPYWNGPVM